MKRAKIVLGVVAVFAILGGAFAFKAKQATSVFTHKAGDPANVCTVEVLNRTFTTTGALISATSDPELPCVQTRITITD